MQHPPDFLPARLRTDADLCRLLFVSYWNSDAVGLAIVTVEGVVETCNDRFARVLGRAPSQVEGVHFREFTHPEDVDADLSMLEQVVRGEREAYTMRKRYVIADAFVWVRLYVRALREPTGGVRLFVAEVIPLDVVPEGPAPIVAAPSRLPPSFWLGLTALILGVATLIVGAALEDAALIAVGTALAGGGGGGAVALDRQRSRPPVG